MSELRRVEASVSLFNLPLVLNLLQVNPAVHGFEAFFHPVIAREHRRSRVKLMVCVTRHRSISEPLYLKIVTGLNGEYIGNLEKSVVNM